MRTAPRTATWSRWLATAMAALVLTWIVGRIANGGEGIAAFDGAEEDGVFQFYNALRRIADGQSAGVDYQLFHGLALPYLHYPMFAMLGKSMIAAEWTRVVVSAIVYPSSILVLCRAFTRRWPAALTLTVITLAGSRYLESLYAPGNSMLSIRAFAPLLVTAALMVRTPRWRALLSGGALALSFLLGIEQGIAAVLAVVVGTLAAAHPRARLRCAAWLLATLTVFAVLTLGVMIALVGWEGAVGTLRYQLRDLPGDQAWYFGVPPNGFLGRWSDLALIALPILAALISLGIIVAKWRHHRRRKVELPPRAVAIVVLLLYGVLSCGSYLGIVSSTYQTVVERSVLLAFILEGYSWVRRSTNVRRMVGAHASNRGVRVVASGAVVAIGVVCAAGLVRRTARIAELRHAPPLSARLENDLRITDSTLASIAGPDATTAPVWSTYAGLFDARRGTFQPAPDYIIHALGVERREQYLRDFLAHRPTLVLTELPAEFVYEEWLQTTSWPFYELLLRQYEVAALTSHRLLWRRLPESAARAPSLAVNVSVPDSGSTSVRLPEPVTGAGAVQVVELEYAARNALRRVPVLGALPRFFIGVSNARNRIPITLPPRGGRVVFPVYRDGRATVDIAANVVSLVPGASLRLTRVLVREWTLAGLDTMLVPPR